MFSRFPKPRLGLKFLEDRTTPSGNIPVLPTDEVTTEQPVDEAIVVRDEIVGEPVLVNVTGTDDVNPEIFQTVGVPETPPQTTATNDIRAVDFDPTRIASADVNGDGKLDTIRTTTAGEMVKVTVEFATLPDMTLTTTNVFESTFTGGAHLAAADMDGDGRAEIAVSADRGGSGRVVVLKAVANPSINVTPDNKFKVFDRLESIASFLGIEDSRFRGGSSVATADLNLDGRSDLIVAAGDSGGPRVAVYDGISVTSLDVAPTTTVQYRGNINPTLDVGGQVTSTIEVFDRRSTARNLNVVLTKTAGSTYSLTAFAPNTTITVPPTVVTFDSNGLLASSATVDLALTSSTQTDTQTIRLNLGGIGQPNGLTQVAGASTFSAINQDGGSSLAIQRVQTNPTRLVSDFFALPDPRFRGGISVDAGDVNGDGLADLIVGAGRGGAQRTRVISGVDVMAGRGATATAFADFFVGGFDSGNREGVLVGYDQPFGDNKFGGFTVYGSTTDATGRKIIDAGTSYLGRNFPKRAGSVPDLDDRIAAQ